MTKRLILAMGIWFALLILWSVFFQPEQQPVPQQTQTGTNAQAAGTTNQTQTDTTQPSEEFGANDPETAGRTAAEQRRHDGDIKARNDTVSNRAATITTRKLQVGLNKIDGTVDSMVLQNYEEDGEKIDFIQKNLRYLGNFRVVFQGLEGANRQPEVLFSHRKLSEYKHEFVGPVPGAEGVQVRKVYSFYPEEYYFDLQVSLVNSSDDPWQNSGSGRAYSLVWGSPVDWVKEKTFYDELLLVAYTLQGDLDELDEDKKRMSAFHWMGLEDRYFLMTVMPVNDKKELPGDNKVNTADIETIEKEESKDIRFALNRSDAIVPKKGALSDNYRVFFGPKRYSLLSSEKLEKYKLDSTFSGFVLIKWIGIGFEQLLYMIYSVLSNFGVAIIVLTVIVKIVLHPLTHKSFVSMRKMQLLQPKLTALREQYKNDQQVLQKKMMELYKKEKVNPMGGCLPLLLQLPIFISLYRLLTRLVDLKNVSFLWIQDLSSPDVLFKLPDVAILPSTFNLLPLIMTGVSVIQSRIQSKGQSASGATAQQQQQNKFMMFLPIIFLFIFWRMPSGLVLYWTIQNLLSIGEQLLINRKYNSAASLEVKKEA